MKKIKLLAVCLIMAFAFSSCATILIPGEASVCQRTKPAPGQPQREVQIEYLVADILLFPIGLIVDFATAKIYKPCVSKEESPKEAIKGANLVKFESYAVENDDLFNRCVSILNESYPLDKINKEEGKVTTQPLRNNYIEYKIELLIISKVVEIRSYVRSLDEYHVAISDWQRGSNKGLAVGALRFGWNKQVEIAEKIKEKIHGTITYYIEHVE